MAQRPRLPSPDAPTAPGLSLPPTRVPDCAPALLWGAASHLSPEPANSCVPASPVWGRPLCPRIEVRVRYRHRTPLRTWHQSRQWLFSAWKLMGEGRRGGRSSGLAFRLESRARRLHQVIGGADLGTGTEGAGWRGEPRFQKQALEAPRPDPSSRRDREARQTAGWRGGSRVPLTWSSRNSNRWALKLSIWKSQFCIKPSKLPSSTSTRSPSLRPLPSRSQLPAHRAAEGRGAGREPQSSRQKKGRS